MKSKILVALCFAAMSFSAIAFELKGLKTGINISSVSDQFQLECSKPEDFEDRDLITDVCVSKFLPSKLETIAEQPVHGVAFQIDKRGTVHDLVISFTCALNEKVLLNALRAKFGKPTEDDIGGKVWVGSGETMKYASLMRLNSPNQKFCGMLSVTDSAYSRWFRKKMLNQMPPNPAKDL